MKDAKHHRLNVIKKVIQSDRKENHINNNHSSPVDMPRYRPEEAFHKPYLKYATRNPKVA
jgi:hypothetical protein